MWIFVTSLQNRRNCQLKRSSIISNFFSNWKSAKLQRFWHYFELIHISGIFWKIIVGCLKLLNSTQIMEIRLKIESIVLKFLLYSKISFWHWRFFISNHPKKNCDLWLHSKNNWFHFIKRKYSKFLCTVTLLLINTLNLIF